MQCCKAIFIAIAKLVLMFHCFSRFRHWLFLFNYIFRKERLIIVDWTARLCTTRLSVRLSIHPFPWKVELAILFV